MRTGRTLAGALVAALLAGCGGDAAAPGAQPPEPSISTLSPLPMPDMGPPEGELVADLRQSSRDAALGRFQVWLGNGQARPLAPTSVSYVDPRFRDPIPGERLREVPAGSERGYPLAEPARPVCDGTAGRGRVVVEHGGRTATIPVEDEADVVARYVATRCFELEVAEVARLSFEDDVESDGGEGSTGTLVLVAEPSGRSGRTLTVETVTGTPVLTAAGATHWAVDETVASDGPTVRIPLSVRPARCDEHVFMESGGATAFRVRLRLDGEPGDLVVRMSPAGAAAAIGFARDSCGLD
jgi:hypothetical protein